MLVDCSMDQRTHWCMVADECRHIQSEYSFSYDIGEKAAQLQMSRSQVALKKQVRYNLAVAENS